MEAVIESKAERFAARAARFFPFSLRRRAKREMKEMVLNMVEDFTGGSAPDILDVRAAIDEIGTPEDLARMYRESAHPEGHRTAERVGFWSSFLEGGEACRKVSFLLSLLAGVLVLVGLIGIGASLFETMLPIFTGCMIALAALVLRSWSAGQSFRPDGGRPVR